MSSRIALGVALTLGLAALLAVPRRRGTHEPSQLMPGNLLVSESTYATPDITPNVTKLPPGCTGTACLFAVADGDPCPR